AGRSGEAILFVTPREKGMLRAIERATRQPIEEMRLPSVQAVNDRRVARFFERISGALEAGGLEPYRELVDRYATEHDVGAGEIAAALARLLQGDTPLFLEAREEPAPRERAAREPRAFEERGPRRARDGDDFAPRAPRAPKPPREAPQQGMETYRVEVGHAHGVKPGNIVGAIANEAGLEARYIGRIDIHDDYSILDLPAGMPPEIMAHLRKAWVVGQQLQISQWDGTHTPSSGAPGAPRSRFRPGGPRPGGKPHRKGPP